jgi:TPR repeat protein
LSEPIIKAEPEILVVERRPRWRDSSPAAGVAVAVTVLLILICGLLFLQRCGRWPFPPRPGLLLSAADCPRPDLTGQAPGFGDQQRQVRHLREAGFGGDFFAQLELGRRYQAKRDTDRNLIDPVESAVWYALALTNPTGYAPVVLRPSALPRVRGSAASLYEDCRAFERGEASQRLDRLWSQMSSADQQEVRQRVIYVLYSQGAAGFRTLARVTASGAGPYGEPLNSDPPVLSGLPVSGPVPVDLFARNDVDAYLYSYLAAQSGDIGGYVLLKDFERNAGPEYGDFAQAKAARWVPPFEFYPADAPASGVPHSDESRLDSDADETALARMDELPFIHVGRALAFLQVIPFPAVFPPQIRPDEIRTFEAMLGRPQAGRLSNLEKVRAIQYAAVNGSAKAQLVLAVMYSEGVGVRADYARAYAWYQRADRQGSGEAKFAIANYFSLGVEGVTDQDKAKAVVYRLDSALAGFQPSADRIQAVLAQVSRKVRN